MKKHNYLVSVFVRGRNVNSYFSENLDDLITIKALNKDCEINIFDLQSFSTMPKEQVEIEIKKSGERWKKSLDRNFVEKPQSTERTQKSSQKKPEKKKKYWERTVMCVETGQVFQTIRECSEKTGIPYMTIVNCIKNKNATRGVHFVNATKTEQNSYVK